MTTLIDLETCQAIRKALITGLSSFGEIERLGSAYSIHTKIAGDTIPDDLRPMRQAFPADAVGDFADALLSIDLIESGIREAEREKSETAPA